jgi:D-arabinose 1-dehydrogenase-like Zn-dependent alcohol dehydrogenase
MQTWEAIVKRRSVREYLPKEIPQEVAAPLLCAGITVWAPISKYAKPGMKAAVLGIGGLGHLAVQFLHKLGIDVTAITSSMNKKDYILSLGADRVMDFTNKDDLKKYDSHFDVIINCISCGGDFGKIIKLANVFGVIAQCGLPDQNDKMVLSNDIVSKGVTVVGVALGSVKEIEEMLEFSAKHKIFPKCEQFGFEELPKAFNHLEFGKPNFRCVVNVKDFSEKNGFFR